MVSPTAVKQSRKKSRFTNLDKFESGALYIVLGGLIVMALAVAFSHTYDLTAHVLPKQDPWKSWVNAAVSELLPIASFIAIRRQWSTKRSIKFSAGVAIFSICVSAGSQLYAAEHVIPGSAEFLAVFPAVAAALVGKIVWTELTFSVKQKERAAKEAERKAAIDARERAEREAEQRREAARAARAAELRRRTEEDRAARAAEREAAREAARLQAERDHELRLEAVRAEKEAAQLAAQEAARTAAHRRQLEEQAALLAAQRAEAAHTAELARQDQEAAARRDLLAAQRAFAAPPAQRNGAARNGGSAATVAGTPPAAGGKLPAREAARMAQEALDALKGDVPRHVAVRAVAAALGREVRTARQFVHADWPAVRTAVVPSRGKSMAAAARTADGT